MLGPGAAEWWEASGVRLRLLDADRIELTADDDGTMALAAACGRLSGALAAEIVEPCHGCPADLEYAPPVRPCPGCAVGAVVATERIPQHRHCPICRWPVSGDWCPACGVALEWGAP